MTAQRCRICGREFPETEQFCSQDGARLTGLGTETESGTATDLDVNVMRDLLVGCTLDGRYRVVRVIGEGGMGVVYEALHIVLEKRVAIKVLRDTFSARADVVERFRQEAKSASRIGHPNIVDVSDFGETPSGQSYIVMEMLTGEDLADLLARVRVLPPMRAVRIVYQVARALDATHKKNIVHRDLKPENIYLVERDGAHDFVKVVDFGVAKMSEPETMKGRKLTRTGMLFGTPEYMSPEQALGQSFDHRIDIYALGAILFELLTGRVPFVGESFMGILSQHGHAPLPSLQSVNPSVSVSHELTAIVQRALAKDPAARYQTMDELAEGLRNTPEMPAPAGAETRAPKWSPTAPFAIVQAEDDSEARETAITSEVGPKHGRQARPRVRSDERSVTARTLPALTGEAVSEDVELSDSALAGVQSLGTRFALSPHMIRVGLVAVVLMFGMVAIAAQRTTRPRLLQGSSSSLSHAAPVQASTQTLVTDFEHGVAPVIGGEGTDERARESAKIDGARTPADDASCGSAGCSTTRERGVASRPATVSNGVSTAKPSPEGESEARDTRTPRERRDRQQPLPDTLADHPELDTTPGSLQNKRSAVPAQPALRKSHAPTDLKIPSAFR